MRQLSVILRVRDRWGRKKRDNERRYEEERIVPSMEEAVEAEVRKRGWIRLLSRSKR